MLMGLLAKSSSPFALNEHAQRTLSAPPAAGLPMSIPAVRADGLLD